MFLATRNRAENIVASWTLIVPDKSLPCIALPVGIEFVNPHLGRCALIGTSLPLFVKKVALNLAISGSICLSAADI